jgi:hypothetical protein
MVKKKKGEQDIVIRAVPPRDVSEAQRLRLAQVVVDMLRNRGFLCDLVVPDEEA